MRVQVALLLLPPLAAGLAGGCVTDGVRSTTVVTAPAEEELVPAVGVSPPAVAREGAPGVYDVPPTLAVLGEEDERDDGWIVTPELEDRSTGALYVGVMQPHARVVGTGPVALAPGFFPVPWPAPALEEDVELDDEGVEPQPGSVLPVGAPAEVIAVLPLPADVGLGGGAMVAVSPRAEGSELRFFGLPEGEHEVFLVSPDACEPGPTPAFDAFGGPQPAQALGPIGILREEPYDAVFVPDASPLDLIGSGVSVKLDEEAQTTDIDRICGIALPREEVPPSLLGPAPSFR